MILSNVIKSGAVFLVLFFLTGCGPDKQIEIAKKPQQKQKLNLIAEPIKLNEVKFHVLINKTGSICVSSDYYENLSENMLILKNHIKEQKLIIQKYRDYYEK